MMPIKRRICALPKKGIADHCSSGGSLERSSKDKLSEKEHSLRGGWKRTTDD